MNTRTNHAALLHGFLNLLGSVNATLALEASDRRSFCNDGETSILRILDERAGTPSDAGASAHASDARKRIHPPCGRFSKACRVVAKHPISRRALLESICEPRAPDQLPPAVNDDKGQVHIHRGFLLHFTRRSPVHPARHRFHRRSFGTSIPRIYASRPSDCPTACRSRRQGAPTQFLAALGGLRYEVLPILHASLIPYRR